jgi:hypothetical protein
VLSLQPPGQAKRLSAQKVYAPRRPAAVIRHRFEARLAEKILGTAGDLQTMVDVGSDFFGGEVAQAMHGRHLMKRPEAGPAQLLGQLWPAGKDQLEWTDLADLPQKASNGLVKLGAVHFLGLVDNHDWPPGARAQHRAV